jgi:hypothetical protein
VRLLVRAIALLLLINAVLKLAIDLNQKGGFELTSPLNTQCAGPKAGKKRM